MTFVDVLGAFPVEIFLFLRTGRSEDIINVMKTTPTPNKNGSRGIKVGVRMP